MTAHGAELQHIFASDVETDDEENEYDQVD